MESVWQLGRWNFANSYKRGFDPKPEKDSAVSEQQHTHLEKGPNQSTDVITTSSRTVIGVYVGYTSHWPGRKHIVSTEQDIDFCLTTIRDEILTRIAAGERKPVANEPELDAFLTKLRAELLVHFAEGHQVRIE